MVAPLSPISEFVPGNLRSAQEGRAHPGVGCGFLGVYGLGYREKAQPGWGDTKEGVDGFELGIRGPSPLRAAERKIML